MTIDKRITVKTDIDGVEYLAIDGKGLRWSYSGSGQPGSKTYRLRAVLRDDRIVFTGGIHGEHSIAAEVEISTATRVLYHWRGYVQTTEDHVLRRTR